MVRYGIWYGIHAMHIMLSKPHQNEVGRSNSGKVSSFRSI